MKERPIIFNAEMVKAILDGRKTQTRRLVNDNHTKAIEFMGGSNEENDEFEFVGLNYGKWGDDSNEHGPEWLVSCTEYPEEGVLPIGQLLGAIGDRLWVRETFAQGLCTKSTLAYKATHKPEDLEEGWFEQIKWTPSIHMPRRASRINLEITNVRVERLKDISEEDALAEGCKAVDMYELTAKDKFSSLWSSIYGEQSWQSNPWVWVVEFKRVEGGAA
jgi:hypothetical protein